MRVSTLAMTLLSCGSSIAAAGLSKRAEAISPGNGISVQDYLDCLNNEVKNWGWNTNSCEHQGRITFWRRGRSWDSPWDCYTTCHDEIADAIKTGWPDRECSHTAGAAQCWMGYNTRQ
ncbi:hypothetical protein QBC47DRAFT_366177 [Echria macrotheca]|uniref:Uncharacterized protein n=1 Tax=Echria macrotheca TaxID=438768 RepID=A0AAJ0B0K0_9PEZI|nr:hypothetical protein QBC47DRAFT_366177 [Echria macrotheca]